MSDAKCDLCDGSGVIHVDLDFGYAFQPCPRCNQAFQARLKEAAEEPKQPRKKAAQ